MKHLCCFGLVINSYSYVSLFMMHSYDRRLSQFPNDANFVIHFNCKYITYIKRMLNIFNHIFWLTLILESLCLERAIYNTRNSYFREKDLLKQSSVNVFLVKRQG